MPTVAQQYHFRIQSSRFLDNRFSDCTLDHQDIADVTPRRHKMIAKQLNGAVFPTQMGGHVIPHIPWPYFVADEFRLRCTDMQDMQGGHTSSRQGHGSLDQARI